MAANGMAPKSGCAIVPAPPLPRQQQLFPQFGALQKPAPPPLPPAPAPVPPPEAAAPPDAMPPPAAGAAPQQRGKRPSAPKGFAGSKRTIEDNDFPEKLKAVHFLIYNALSATEFKPVKQLQKEMSDKGSMKITNELKWMDGCVKKIRVNGLLHYRRRQGVAVELDEQPPEQSAASGNEAATAATAPDERQSAPTKQLSDDAKAFLKSVADNNAAAIKLIADMNANSANAMNMYSKML